LRRGPALLLLGPLALQACVVLPVPQRVVRYPTLVGKVVHDESGEAAAGAIVSIGPPGSGPSTRSNERGEFELVTTGWRFPYTSALAGDDPMPVIETIWVTVGDGASTKSQQIGHLTFYPPSFADPGDRNATPAELGVVRLRAE
jgi:hypothetical protein